MANGNGTTTQDAPETFSNVTPVEETFSNVAPVAGTSAPFTFPHSFAEAGTKLKNMFSPSGAGVALRDTPGSDSEAVREGSGPALTGLGTIGLVGAPVEAIAKGSLAPLYPIIRAYLGAKAGGYVGKDIGEWLSDDQNKVAGGKTGKQWGEYAGGLISAFGGNVVSPKEYLLKKALAAFEAEAPEAAATGEAVAGPKPPDIAGGPASFRAGTGAAKKVSASNIADQVVANSTGVKPLEPNVPLREQVPVAKPATPTTPAQPAPNYAYRVRSQGEEGLPIGGSGSNAAHATTTLEDAQRLAPGRESVTGEPQEIVRFDLNGKDHVRIPRDNGPDWVRMNQPLSESDVQRADVNGNFAEAKPAAPKPAAPAATSGETDPLKIKYPDPAQRQMVRANGERIVQAIGNDPDTMKAVHNLTRVDLRQAAINHGIDMGQTTVSNSKFAGEGSITREAMFNKLLDAGLKPSEIVSLAKQVPQ